MEPEQKTETREELKKRLRQKIRNSRNSRVEGITRDKNNQLNDSVKKLCDFLATKKIESPEQIDHKLIETIMNIITKKDLELILKNTPQSSIFKDLLSNINEKCGQNL